MLDMVFISSVREPSLISTIAMTAATPMMMPSVVSAERIRLRRSAPKAVRNVAGISADNRSAQR